MNQKINQGSTGEVAVSGATQSKEAAAIREITIDKIVK